MADEKPLWEGVELPDLAVDAIRKLPLGRQIKVYNALPFDQWHKDPVRLTFMITEELKAFVEQNYPIQEHCNG